MSGPLKVNFSEREATSTVRDILPSGEYFCNLVDGSTERVKPGRPNVGKPYWKVRFVVQEGAYSGSSINATVMLFDGALYSLAQLLKAMGFELNTGGDFVIPDLTKLFGKPVIVKGIKRPAETKDGQELQERFEVRGYKKATNTRPKTGNTSLLP
jgi:hypothetical protein